MGKKLLDNKLAYMILAIFLSIVLWFYVSTLQGVQSSKTIYNIPITFVGVDILQENDLMLVGEPPSVNLEVRAGLTTLAKLDTQSLSVRVDVSRITGATEYTLGYDIVSSAGISEDNYTVISREPANVTFTVARYDTVEIPVVGALAEGSSIADGYVGRGFQFSTETIQVSGMAEQVAQVKSALVTISAEELSETVQESKTYQLLGADRKPLEDLDVTCFPETVEATYEIWKEIEVPLKVVLEPGGGATQENNVSFFDISPASVTVLGRPEDVATLVDLTVDTINLANVDGTQIFIRDIPLAEGLEISGGTGTATITITVDGLEQQTFEVSGDAITLNNTPEGFRADVRTSSLAVTIRGTPEALEQASADNIRVSADLSKVELANGQYAVPAKVQFDGVEGAGVLGSDYQIMVRLTKLN